MLRGHGGGNGTKRRGGFASVKSTRARGRPHHSRGRITATYRSREASSDSDDDIDVDPVRAEYAERFIEFIDAELEEEQWIIQQRLNTWPLEKLCREGFVILGVEAHRKGYFYGQQILTFSKPSAELPYHRFSQGDAIVISSGKIVPAKGVVLDSSKRAISAVFQTVPASIDGLWRMDQGTNTVSHSRMMRALKLLVKDEIAEPERSASWSEAIVRTSMSQGRVTLLGDVFFGESPREAAAMPAEHSDQVEVSHTNINFAQETAIIESLKRRVSIIHGPPGTGKTWASIHLIKAWTRIAERPILACADSNIAVDNLVEGLMKLGVKVVRLGHPIRVRKSLTTSTLDVCMSNHPQFAELKRKKNELDGLYASLPGLFGKDRGLGHRDLSRGWSQYRQLENKVISEVIAQSEVVCCTLIGSGADFLEGMSFPFVLIDEATQATEPATMVALTHGSTHVVLAGDHQQLSPVVLSDHRKATSLFERLVDAGVETYLLNVQYRMHPAIVDFPSCEFYNNKLVNGVTAADRAIPSGFRWPVATVPVAFICMKNEETQVDKSRMNHSEATTVVDLINGFMRAYRDRKRDCVAPGDIGVISPYLAQVTLLSSLLRGTDVEVKTVDGFQGREKEIIIFSAVRCNRAKEIGFLGDYRRLNVAITRPRRGLIVVGDPETLSADIHLSRWLNWANRTGLFLEPQAQKLKIYIKNDMSNESF